MGHDPSSPRKWAPEAASIHSVSFPTGRPLAASAEFRIGVRSVPYLADHGFQAMSVLPGSFYILLALVGYREHFNRGPGLVRNVTCQPAITLSAADTVLSTQ